MKSNAQLIAIQTTVLFIVLLFLFYLMNMKRNSCVKIPKASFYIMFFLAVFIIALSSIIIQAKDNISQSNFNFAVVFLINAIFVVIASLIYSFNNKDVIRANVSKGYRRFLNK